MPNNFGCSSGGFYGANAAHGGYGTTEANAGWAADNCPTVETAIDGSNGGRHTSDDSPARSRKISNRQTCPLHLKVAKLRTVKGDLPKTALSGPGTSFRYRGPVKSENKSAGPHEVDAYITYESRSARATLVVFRGRLWRAE